MTLPVANYGGSLVDTLARAASLPVKEVQIRSQILPTIRYRPEGPRRPPTPLEKLTLSIVKPAITVETSWDDYEWEPYGAPDKNLTWVLPTLGAFALVGTIALSAFVARQI